MMHRNVAFSLSLFGAVLWSGHGPAFGAGPLTNFGTVTTAPAMDLNGSGSDVDSIAFWEAPDPADTLMFVTGKANDLVEVWEHPFAGNELAPLRFPANVNGVLVDQESDRLYVSDRIVSVVSLPAGQLQGTFGQALIGVGENNLALLKHSNGQTWIYVSDDHNVHRFNAATAGHLGSFAPPVSSIETLVADNFHQMILVAEEQGPAGNPGVFAYHPDGTPFHRDGTNRFGNGGEFDSDEEGMLLYTFPAHGSADDGSGFVLVADQRSDVTDFEFFDRQTWAHLGRLRLTGVSNTDGVASTQRAMPGYPLGVFAAIDNDSTTAVIGWDAVFAAIGWDLAPEAVRITPAPPGPGSAGSVDFAVVFSEPVAGFDDVSDLVITHNGTSSTGVAISGSAAVYSVTISGITGSGSVALAVNTSSDVRDLANLALASSVTSSEVAIETPYRAWALASGLTVGSNDGFADDPDGDAVPNAAEFATAGDPLRSDSAIRDRAALNGADGSKYFTYTFPVRQGAVFAGPGPLSSVHDGVVYTLSASLDLTNFKEELVEWVPALQAGLPALDQGWTYRTFQMSRPVSDLSAGFVLLTITPAPE